MTQDNIDQTICVSGWTATIRPGSSYTSKLKIEQIKEYSYKDKKPGDYEEDHLISLQLGGHPTDPRNLWPQPYNQACGARIKDVLETRLKRLVCDKKLPLADAQKAIATNLGRGLQNVRQSGRLPSARERAVEATKEGLTPSAV